MMRILKVIHGYPMLYNAGSEVYSQTLCHGLVDQEHDVRVLSREEDAFRPDGAMRMTHDELRPEIRIDLVNNPRHRDRYQLGSIDRRFAETLDDFRPQIVHVGHLNHLSTSLITEAKKRNIPVVYTIHDYWLMCPRGQFMQMHSADHDLWAACDGQENSKCAEKCYARYFSGAPGEIAEDMAYWESWVARRMAHVRAMVDLVDVFISPSRYLKERYETDFGLPASKSIYLDYGFDCSRMTGRHRIADEPFTFGYIGTHIPAKGIHHLITAFGNVPGGSILRIWGRDRGQDSRALRAIAANLPNEADKRVQWMPEYRNTEIVREVFSKVDAIVTPSIWVENSPLVIHEAQQARVPVITARVGGMAEYVGHMKNGLLFDHRNTPDLADKMRWAASHPKEMRQFGERGYLYSDDGNIQDIASHVGEIVDIYNSLVTK